MRTIIIIFIVITYHTFLFSQNSDCTNAIAVCQNNYVISTSQGIGIQTNELPAGSCLSGENNSTWFVITPQTAGTLRFLVTPNSPTEDFNWAVYDISNASCADISTNPALEIACNNSSDLVGSNPNGPSAGETGAFTNSPWFGGIFPFFPAFSGDINIQAGGTYLLYIKNTSANGQGQGYSIDFSGSTANLFNSSLPNLDSVIVPGCGATTMQIYFNKSMRCNSVSVSDFNVLTSSGILIPTSVISPNCTGAFDGTATSFTLTFPNTFLPDNYTFQIINNVSDACGNILSSFSLPFNIPTLPVHAGNDILICSGQAINQNIGMMGLFPNQTFQWSAEPASYLSNLSSTTSASANLNIAQMPIDTVLFIITTASPNGCTASDTMLVFGNDCCTNFEVSITNFTNIGCFGTSIGTATAAISGSESSIINYVWNSSPQQFTSTATSLSANQIYTVSATDGNLCEDTVSIILTEPASAISASTIGSNVSCLGGSDGMVDLTVNGGTQPYTYVWNNNVATQDLINIAAGTYSVTVADANNCTITATRTVNQPPTALTANSTGSTINCMQTTGTISLNISGGGSPYLVNWSNNLGSSLTLNGLIPGTYVATITDNNGCEITNNGVVNSTTNISTATTTTAATCDLVADGTITLSVSGGLSPYNFAWDNGAGMSQNPTNLLPGNYSVTITDANGCLVASSVTVGSNGAMEATAIPTDVSCFNANDGSIILNINGGQLPFIINWNNGLSNTQNPTNISGNIYIATVTDGIGCTDTAQAIVNEPGDIIINESKTNVNCNGANTGNIQLFLSGGTGPFTANWQGLSGSGLIQNNLTIGNYTVTVTDVNGCQKSKTIAITQPNILSISLIPTLVSCYNGNDGSIQTVINGGTSAYSFAWSNGFNTQNISNLIAGNYTVTVTDANGCIKTESIIISQPSSFSGTLSPTAISCFGGSGGSISTSPIGGTFPYTYAWSNGLGTAQNPQNISVGNYTVTITDANNCTSILTTTITQSTAISASVISVNPTCNNMSNGSIQTTVSGGILPYTYIWSNGLGTVQNPQNISAGSYTVTITDANNCTTTTATNLTAPTGITATFNNLPASCFNINNGSISMIPSGGTSPYTYAWANGLGTVQNPQNISAGNYTVTIMDANNCTSTISTIILSPPIIVITTVETSPACGLNGTITANVSGGNLPYSYNWSVNANTGNTNVADSLSGGSYWLTVTDAFGCLEVSSIITLGSSSNLVVELASVQPECQAQTGSIGITPTSGVAPFSYNWTPNANAGNINVVSGLGGGTYGVTVTDAFGCDTVLSHILNPATVLVGTATVINATCGEDNGSISYNVTSGTSPYTYAWSNTPINTDSIGSLPSGDYDLVLTDGNNCSILETITVQGTEGLMIEDSVIQMGCEEAGGIYLTISGGNEPYNYIWSANANTGNSENAINLIVGIYEVTITDANNCAVSASYELDEIIPFSIETVQQIDNDCYQGASGRVTVNAINTTNTVTYLWSDGQNGATAINLEAGNYTVSVTDIVRNCQQIESFIITEPEEYIIDIGVDFAVEIGSSVTLEVNNPRFDYIYTWEGTDGFTGEGTFITTTINETTTFTVLGTLPGCPPVQAIINIKTTASVAIEIPNAFSPNNDGKNDVFRVATSLSITIVDFKVFNRYGEIIYNSTEGEWNGTHNGKKVLNGGYRYIIIYITSIGEEVIRKGEVILIR